jgi:hypothetical protein
LFPRNRVKFRGAARVRGAETPREKPPLLCPQKPSSWSSDLRWRIPPPRLKFLALTKIKVRDSVSSVSSIQKVLIISLRFVQAMCLRERQAFAVRKNASIVSSPDISVESVLALTTV